jgi:hypothetical protein
MAMDPQVRGEAKGHLSTLFSGLGSAHQNPGALGGLGLGDVGQQFQEFVEMPIELASIFLNMSVELAELVLTSLEKAGYTLVKGMTPL